MKRENRAKILHILNTPKRTWTHDERVRVGLLSYQGEKTRLTKYFQVLDDVLNAPTRRVEKIKASWTPEKRAAARLKTLQRIYGQKKGKDLFDAKQKPEDGSAEASST